MWGGGYFFYGLLGAVDQFGGFFNMGRRCSPPMLDCCLGLGGGDWIVVGWDAWVLNNDTCLELISNIRCHV